MNVETGRSGRDREQPLVSEVDRDLRALRTLTETQQPEIQTVVRAARSRRGGETRGGFSMAMQLLQRRPVLATGLALIVVALGLFVIPVSYQRTVGYDVALKLEGANLSPQRVAEIATGLKSAIGAHGVSVVGDVENGKLAYALTAEAKGDVRQRAASFERLLDGLGYVATVTTTPRKETVAGNVYAYAASLIIQVPVDSGSAAQIEADIKQKLAAAGVTNAEVSVIDDGQRHDVKVKAERTGDVSGQPMPELVLTKGGAPLTGGSQVRIMKKRDASGAVTLVVSTSQDGKDATVEIPNANTMTDAALAAELQSKLQAAGLDVTVHVNGSEITVEKRTP